MLGRALRRPEPLSGEGKCYIDWDQLTDLTSHSSPTAADWFWLERLCIPGCHWTDPPASASWVLRLLVCSSYHIQLNKFPWSDLGPIPKVSHYICANIPKLEEKNKVLTTSRQGIFNLYLKTGSSRRSNKYFTVGCWVVRKLIQDSFGSGKGMLAHTLFSPLLQWTPCTSDTMRMVCNIMVGIQQSLWIIITSFFFS